MASSSPAPYIRRRRTVERARWACWSMANGGWTASFRPTRGQAISFVPIRRSATGSRPTARPGRPGRRLPRGGGALPSLCLARLPVGASHADLPQAQGPGGDHRRLRRQLVHGRRRLDLRAGAGRRSRSAARREIPSRDLCRREARLYRPRQRARALGQGDRADRQQRIRRHHPHVQLRLRRRRRDAGRLLPAGPARGDRRDQRAHLRDRQQRRLPLWLRPHAGRL